MLKVDQPEHSTVKNYLIISVLGEDRPGVVDELSRVILDSGCRISDGRMSILGAELAVTLMVYGNWSTLAKLEVQLKRLEHSLGIMIIAKRTQDRKRDGDLLPYAVEVVALDQPGTLSSLTSFFTARSINLEDLSARGYNAPHTGASMFSVNLIVGVPADTHIALLREEFMDFCDQLNLDAVIEPVRG
jgi:glycine cleavage system transcriptional repressor